MDSRLGFNWYGSYMLYLREVRRFLKVYHQTLVAPVVSALIFLSIFYLALSNHNHTVHGVAFLNFMGYGLIIMTIVQNAFANTSSSLIMAKVIGYINDILMPPFSGLELAAAYILGAISRGLIVGSLVAISLTPIIDFKIYSLFGLIYYVLSACILMGLLGIISALIADNFDQSSAITSYIITPLSFLSGTFYSVEKLPTFAKTINNFNPFFYIIDGFRYCLTAHSDGNILYGAIFLLILNIIIGFITIKLLNTGWRLKN